jgi:hypothetical protein
MISNSMKQDLEDAFRRFGKRSTTSKVGEITDDTAKKSNDLSKKEGEDSNLHPKNFVAPAPKNLSQAVPEPDNKIPSQILLEPQSEEILLKPVEEKTHENLPPKPDVPKSKENTEANMEGIKVKKSGKKSKTIVVVAVVIFIALGASAVFYFQSKKQNGVPVNNNQPNNAPAGTGNNAVPVNDASGAKVKNANDSIRLEKIDTIADAVAAYFLQDKVDLPISPIYTKLSEDNPVSQFVKDALKKSDKPEDTMLDPKNPDFYFAYKSVDGENIELTARMEDEASAACVKDSANPDICVFSKVLSEDDINKMGVTPDSTTAQNK